MSEDIKGTLAIVDKILSEISKVVIGKDDIKDGGILNKKKYQRV